MKQIPHCVVGLGEILWDVFQDKKTMGGAPANFAYHCHVLGAQAFVVSALGKDQEGKTLLDKLQDLNINCKYLQNNHFNTGKVLVSLDEKKQPSYTIENNAAWDHIAWNHSLEELALKCQAGCVGSLAQRSPESRQSIQAFLKKMQRNSLRIFDINLRANDYTKKVIKDTLDICNILKINKEELGIILDMLEVKDLKSLREKYKLKMCILTLAEKGSILDTEKERSIKEVANTQLVDPVGAGDAFTAAIAMGLLSQLPLKVIHQNANQYASYICSQKGATPSIDPSFLSTFL